MKLYTQKSVHVTILRREGGQYLYCPFVAVPPHCSDSCPFCCIDEMQIVLRCTGTPVIFERIQPEKETP